MYNVYLMKVYENEEGNYLYKIGRTKRKVEERLKEFKTGNPNIEFVTSFKSIWGTKIESYLHKIYKSKNVSGEWFLLTEENVNSFLSDCKKIHDGLEIINNDNTYINKRGYL